MPQKVPNPIDKHVGSRVRMRRMMLGMSQEKLGDALGLTFQQIQKYEKGSNRIGASRLQQISLILQVPVSFFFEGAPPPPGRETGFEDAPSPAYVTDFLATSDGLTLVKAFMRIPNSKLRRRIVELVEEMAGGDAVYNNPGLWHFRFHGPTPEALVLGRERTYFEHYWNDFAADKNRSIPEADRSAYTSAYSRPGRMKAGWAYFASFPRTAQDFSQLSRTRLTMPMLSIGGDKSLGKELGEQAKLVGSDVSVVVLQNAGHWILEEQPAATTEALRRFLEAPGPK